jgi:hypothetical protein
MVVESDMRGHAVEKAYSLGVERKPISEINNDLRGNAVLNAPSNAVFEFKGKGNDGPPPVLLSVPTKKVRWFQNVARCF